MAKTYDRLFKSLAEEDPRGLLDLFGRLPLDVSAEVEVLDRELGLPVLSVDHLYRVRTPEREWLIHLEAQTRYRADVPNRLCLYGASLGLKYRLPIDTVLVVLVEGNAPEQTEQTHRMEFGCISIISSYHVVKLWELDGEPVFSRGRHRLLPWLILMRSSNDLLREAARRIVETRNGELLAQFRLLGGLRYDNNQVADFLGRAGFMLSEEIIKESSFYRDILERGLNEGLLKGRNEGLVEGRNQEACRVISQVIAIRFPGLEVPPLAGLSLEQLESLFDTLLRAADRDSARRELARLAR